MYLSAIILNVYLLSEVFSLLPRAARPNRHSPLQQVKHMNQIARSRYHQTDKYGSDGPIRRHNHNILRQSQDETNQPMESLNFTTYIPRNLMYIKAKNKSGKLKKNNNIFMYDYMTDIGRVNDRSDSNPMSSDSYDNSQNDRNGKLISRQGLKRLFDAVGIRKGHDRSDSNSVSSDNYGSSQNDRNGKSYLRHGDLNRLLDAVGKKNGHDRSDSNPVSSDSYDSSQNDRKGRDKRLLVWREGGHDRSDSNSVSSDSYDSSQNDGNGKSFLRHDERPINVLMRQAVGKNFNGNDRSDSNSVSSDSYDSSQIDKNRKSYLRQDEEPINVMLRQAVGNNFNAQPSPKEITGQELASEELDFNPTGYDTNGMMYLSRPDKHNEERELNVLMNRAVAEDENIGRVLSKSKSKKRTKDPLEKPIRPKYDTNGMMYLSEPDNNNTERKLSALLNKVVKYQEDGKPALRGTSLVEIFDADEIRLMEDAVYTLTVEETQNEQNQNGRRSLRTNITSNNSPPRIVNKQPSLQRIPIRREARQLLNSLFNFNTTFKFNVTTPDVKKMSLLTKYTKSDAIRKNVNITLKSTPKSSVPSLKVITAESRITPNTSNVDILRTFKPTINQAHSFRSALNAAPESRKQKKQYISPKIFDIYDMLL